MSQFKVYINPLDDFGNFTEFIDVSDDLLADSIGAINQVIDNDRFNVGNFKFDSFSIRLRNEEGTYSDVTSPTSIFKLRRGGSKVRVTWFVQDYTECGTAICGWAKISPEVQVFEGVLNDESSTLDIDDQQVKFDVLSYDSVFPAIEAPFGSINIGDLYSEILLTILNQPQITQYLTVDALNINVGLDQTVDNIAELENTTVKEVLDKILFQSNSVFYIYDNTIFIKNRDGGATPEKVFYGQASNAGIEDIIKISKISIGLNNIFNYWTWSDTTLLSQDSSSITDNGVRKKSVEFDEITDNGKRQAVLDANRIEFSTKFQEMTLTVPMSYENLELQVLDQVRVDYPTVYIPDDPNDTLPIYGVAIYGVDRYPLAESSIVISPQTKFKIIGKRINTKDQLINFKIKEFI